MFKKSIFFFILVSLCLTRLAAQEEEKQEEDLFHKTIDTAMAISPAYLPTYYTELGTVFFKPINFKPIDTTMNLIAQYDPLLSTDNLYQTLGIHGQAHKPMNFTYKKDPGFSLFSIPYPLYFKEQGDLKYYKLKTSYTNLAFEYGIANEYTFQATHAQNIKDKVNYAFNLRGFSNDGYYTHQKASDIVFDALVHYEIPSHIYGFKLSYIINYFNLEENGGLLDMEEYVNQLKLEDLKGYNMKLYNATSKLLTHDLLFQQYVNIISQNKKKGKESYWGTITHSFQFKHQRTNYNDFNLDSSYYRTNYFISDTTADTMRYYTISNTLQWSSFKPLQDDNDKKYFLHFTGGLTHEYARYQAGSYTGNAFIPFAQVHVRLFSRMDIHAKIHYTLGGYHNNDLNANAAVIWAINRPHNHYLGADIDYYFQTPDYMYSHFFSNSMYWNINWAKKQNILRFSAYWEREGYKAEVNYFLLHNFAIIDSTWTPQLVDKYANIIQLHLSAPVYIKGFGAKANVYLQYSNNPAFHVPIFAGKLDAFYRLNIFKNKAKFQVGFSLAYNTSYYADTYCPMLKTFCTQEDVKVGNYLYFDPHIALQVQRISIYFKVTHALCGLLRYNYFTTPDYPMQNRRFIIGITWRFFD